MTDYIWLQNHQKTLGTYGRFMDEKISCHLKLLVSHPTASSASQYDFLIFLVTKRTKHGFAMHQLQAFLPIEHGLRCHCEVKLQMLLWWNRGKPTMLKLHDGHMVIPPRVARSFHADFASAPEWGSQRLAVRRFFSSPPKTVANQRSSGVNQHVVDSNL